MHLALTFSPHHLLRIATAVLALGGLASGGALAKESSAATDDSRPAHEIDLRSRTTDADVVAEPETRTNEADTDADVQSDEDFDCAGMRRHGGEMLDRTRRQVESMVCFSTLWFDGLFGDNEYPDRKHRISGRVKLAQTYSEFYGDVSRLRFDARFDLPNLNDRFSGFIGRNNDDDFIADRLENSALRSRFPQLEDHDQWLAGLGYRLPSRRTLRSDFRIGVHGVAHPEAFAQLRGHYLPYSDERNLVVFRATPFWTTESRFGITAGGDYSHVLNPQLLVRWRNGGTLSEITDGVHWGSAMTLFQGLSGTPAGFAYEIFLRGATDDDVSIQDYGGQLTFRHPIARRRLYGEWVVGYSYPRRDESEERKGSLQLALAIEMPFGLHDTDD